jgi:hypothetical protein
VGYNAFDSNLKARGRPTRLLLELVTERFHACDECSKGAYDPLDDVVKPLRLSSREAHRVDQDLSCPGCDAPLRLSNYVVAYTDEEMRSHRRFKRWSEKYSNRVTSFTDFSAEMQKTVTHALIKAHTIELEPSTWYRCTLREPTSVDSFFPRTLQNPGRFNHVGQAAFYLAKERETAAIECSQDRTPEERIKPLWIAEVAVEKRIRVLDVRQPFPYSDREQKSAFLQGLIKSSFLRNPKSGNRPVHREYLLTQMLADAVRWRKLDGIIYTSSQEYPYSYRVFGTALVMFNNFRDVANVLTHIECVLTEEDDSMGLPNVGVKSISRLEGPGPESKTVLRVTPQDLDNR